MDIQELYTTYFTTVYKYAYSLSRDMHIAEEVTQETFFKALRQVKSFRGDCKIQVWLCQIAKNCYFDYLRKHRRTQPLEEEPSFAATADGPDAALINHETAMRIHKCLHYLKEPYKEVFSLRAFGELSFSDIGNIFGKSESWARVTFHRAKMKIREELQNENYV